MATIFDKNYDMILPVGCGCPTSIALGYCRMRFVSSPFDWIRVPDITTPAQLLAQRMERFMEVEDLEIEGENADHLRVVNNRWGWLSVHDFPIDKPLAEGASIAMQKYGRRISRMLERLDAGCSVLLLWMDYPAEEQVQEISLLEAALKQIQQAYPQSQFSLLYLHNHDRLSYEMRQETHHAEDLCSIQFCYNAADPVREIDAHDALLAAVFKRVRLGNKFADPKSYRRYERFTRNVGEQEAEWLERWNFSRNLAKLIMKKRFVWKICRLLYTLSK